MDLCYFYPARCGISVAATGGTELPNQKGVTLFDAQPSS